jgi:hypothetical protein
MAMISSNGTVRYFFSFFWAIDFVINAAKLRTVSALIHTISGVGANEFDPTVRYEQFNLRALILNRFLNF